MEVNIPVKYTASVKRAISEYETNKTSLPSNLFDDCETVILNNMLDMYTRFFKSAAFQAYLAKQGA